jgi:hypothetical protein
LVEFANAAVGDVPTRLTALPNGCNEADAIEIQNAHSAPDEAGSNAVPDVLESPVALVMVDITMF